MLNPQDRKHRAAVEALSGAARPLVTTAWVLTELADGLCSSKTRSLFLSLEDRLRKQRLVTILPPDERLYHLGLALYRDRPDKDWSLTDCISFVVMRERGLTEALTGDHHFEQAGFTALLKWPGPTYPPPKAAVAGTVAQGLPIAPDRYVIPPGVSSLRGKGDQTHDPG
ncbi:MAG: type II toxin-antitoxin system VapC family toxin [Planctomycetes bacterium]|nr:type II toxin-antitoxin system VapC family toxin [Planctomycetota bacterium]